MPDNFQPAPEHPNENEDGDGDGDDQGSQPSSQLPYYNCHKCRKVYDINYFVISKNRPSTAMQCPSCRKQKLYEFEEAHLNLADGFDDKQMQFDEMLERELARRREGVHSRSATPETEVIHLLDDEDEDGPSANKQRRIDTRRPPSRPLSRASTIRDDISDARFGNNLGDNRPLSNLDINQITSKVSQDLAKDIDKKFERQMDVFKSMILAMKGPAGLATTQALALEGTSTFEEKVKALYPWVPLSLALQVSKDELPAEQLPRLRNPKGGLSKDMEKPTFKYFDDGEGPPKLKADESMASKSNAFYKAVQTVLAFIQLWNTYVGIRACAEENPGAWTGCLLHFCDRVIWFASQHEWKAVCDYVINVCRNRFGRSAPSDWLRDDQECMNDFLLANRDRPVMGPPANTSRSTSRSQSSNKASSYKSNEEQFCWRWNMQKCTFKPCKHKHACSVCGSEQHKKRSCGKVTASAEQSTTATAAASK